MTGSHRRPQERRSSLPVFYTELIEHALKKRGFSLTQPKALADSVMKLSNFYLENPTAYTPWDETWAQVASLVYFFPLNYSRAALVAREARRLGFFRGIDTVIDDGAGMGSAIHAFRDHVEHSTESIHSWRARDVARESLDLLRDLSPKKMPTGLTNETVIATELVRGSVRDSDIDKSKSLLIASYVFTELAAIPPEWLEYEALILIEPSTREDSRRLQGERKTLQAAGFSLWAPCPHQADCPLLISDKDWCHDRLHFDAPDWYAGIEKLIPMKNRTLTFSYLCARKTPSPVTTEKAFARLVGDTLNEKGKTRQALCRGPEKEFLAWFPQRFEKGSPNIELERGSLIRLAQVKIEKKANEARLKSPLDLYELGTDEVVPDTRIG